MTLTIQQAIDLIISAVPGAPFSDTVDTVKAGDPSQELTGVIVTFMATCEVIEQAMQLGANLIITHEPTFYNHRDSTDWLGQHASYIAKRQLIEKSGVVIWRFHDYLHSLPPDSTSMGLLQALDWEAQALPDEPYFCMIAPMTLLELGQRVKDRLGLSAIRVVGDLETTCEKVCLLPGFPPAEMQIGALGRPDIDVLITGEIHEWETSEYVRDATHLGFPKGLIIIGHAASEEPGMQWIIPWLRERLPEVVIRFVPTSKVFHYL
ncbi:MAG TPA: Nif3-like dinuclear metal center hexameric protein [Anaerolineales bacterium]|nr:Nif3-like dinuclear metal center hexameric protein [Anaerolineales bacterium]HLO30963.1 Nif3-like dinuclear metal center hexameric protein [Anaerolineales bacterium]